MAEPDERMIELAARAAERALCDKLHIIANRDRSVEDVQELLAHLARAVLALPLLVAARELAEAVEENRGSFDGYNAAADRYRAERAKLEAGS